MRKTPSININKESKSKVKIALFKATILEYGGGIEKYFIETAANLSEKQNVIVDVITLDDHMTDKLVNWQSLYRLKKVDKKQSYKENLIGINKRLSKARYYKEPSIKYLRKRLQEYDIIYSKNELLEAFILRFVLHYKSIPPVVFGGHTALRYPNPQKFHDNLHNILYSGPIYRYLAGGVYKFHVLNEYEAEMYKKLFPNRQIKKIYNPFDIKVFKRQSLQQIFPGLKSIDKNAINILWVGRLVDQKGVRDLAVIIRAINKKLKNRIRIAWNICGDGELRYVVEQLVDKEKNVNYFGHVDQQYIASIYRLNQIFITTSKWESFGYTVVEPQSFGLQIFANHLLSFEEILNTYDGKYLSNDNKEMINQICRLLLRYKYPNQIPKSKPSNVFNQDRIYNELLKFLSVDRKEILSGSK